MTTDFRNNCLSENDPNNVASVKPMHYKGFYWMINSKQRHPVIHSQQEVYYETGE